MDSRRTSKYARFSKLNTLIGGRARIPRWFGILLGLLIAVIGLVLITRPLASLGVLVVVVGVGLILSGLVDLFTEAELSAAGRFIAVGWIVGGVVVLSAPGVSTRLLAIVVGLALILHAIERLTRIRRESHWDGKASSLVLAIAGLTTGLLALVWPDITLLILAVVFGVRLFWYGFCLVWDGVRSSTRHSTAPDSVPQRSPLRRASRLIVALLAVTIALGLVGVSQKLMNGSAKVSAFYQTPESPSKLPGQLLRTEPYTEGVPSTARGWRILYTTTNTAGEPTTASGVVVVPRTGNNHPIVGWAHGTTGFSRQCAPSIDSIGLESGAFFLDEQVINEGWALVATDYAGLGTNGVQPYLIGPGEAHSTLDAIRAARQIPDIDLAKDNVIWGHSQGGNAALWSGQLATTYAPDLELNGVAALAPASDLSGLVSNLPNVTGGSIFASYLVAAYAGTYDNVSYAAIIRPGAQVLAQEMARRCLAEPGVFASVLTALSLSKDPQIFKSDPTTGAFGERLKENTPIGTVSAPLLISQGEADSLVLERVQTAYVKARCATGQPIEYRTYPNRDHVPLVEPDSPAVPDLFAWTRERFKDLPAPSNCR